jgi:DNA-binding MurR/RpiR family transcriptional regulator
MTELPATERRVARALLSHYPAAGLEPAVKLAERAGASAPTVTRYIARLGFAGYREFQQAIRDEMTARMTSPMEQPLAYSTDTPAARLLSDVARVDVELMQGCFASIPPSEFATAVELLADARASVYVVGGRFSHLIAELLDAHLRMLRPRTRAITAQRDEGALMLMEMGRRDALVVFDFRRYQPDVIELARGASDRNCKIVLVTDLWLSPVAEFADVVLPLQTDNGSPFDSLVPAVAIVEALAVAVLARLGDDARARARLVDRGPA